MLPLIDVGQEARGVIAIGQMATGVIAIGQVATGVIAIGQLARGVIAVGMLGLGVVSLGMLALGVSWAGGMIGAGGRAGLGGILPLVPVPERRHAYPRTTSLAALGRGASGWLRVRLIYDSAVGVVFLHRGKRMNRHRLTIDAPLIAAATSLSKQRGRAVANLQAHDTGLVCTRLIEIPPSGLRSALWWATAVGRLLLLIVASVLVWMFALVPLGEALFGAPPG